MKLRIKDSLQEKGLTSVAFSKMLGVSEVTISNLINGKTMPSLNTLEHAAEILSVPIWQLFADPAEIQTKDNTFITCPHCGREIQIEIKPGS